MSTRNDKQEVETTGHSWDGIEEYNNPLPRWWLWIFYATIVWGIGYTVAYPAWPGIKGATAGMLGYSTRGEVAAEIEAVNTQNAEIMGRLADVELASITDDQDLHNFAVNAGAAVFRNNCSQCHGSGAAGADGFPNLLDNDWMWGGTIDDIAFTVTNGIRNEMSPDSRGYGFTMMAYGEMMEKADIDAVVQHVRSISGQEADAALAARGAEVFVENGCGGCHGDNGEGIEGMGAPVLNDAIWLYGGDVASLTQTITNGRAGVMPAWSEEFQPAFGLNQAEINAVAAYVHQLGGGQ